MKISYHWLQEYFEEKLPAPELIAEVLTARAYEVEKITAMDEDTIFDIDVLPNRAHDSLCHRGVAQEIAVLFGLEIKKREYPSLPEKKSEKKSAKKVRVKINDEELCRRYIGVVVENVSITPSPEWLAKKMAAMGQRSINNLVDAANFVMFDMGQPMHIFDAEKIARKEKGEQGEKEEYEIFVRKAKTGEYLETLDGKNVALDENILVIADEKDVLAIAGIKGGKKAEVDVETKTILLEAANFSPTAIRKTAQKTAIRTDASKRFENEISPVLAKQAMEELTRLILSFSPDAYTGEITDEFPATSREALEKFSSREIPVSLQEINNTLGTQLSFEEVETIFWKLEKIGWRVKSQEKNFIVTPDPCRQDISSSREVIEEIGRIYGYGNIVSRLPADMDFSPKRNREFFLAEKVRDILVAVGFSEVETSSFAPNGLVELQNPIAEGKEFLRTNLCDGLEKALELNRKNAPLLGLELNEVKIFEIGTVFFGKNREHTELALAGEKKVVEEGMKRLASEMGIEMVPKTTTVSDSMSTASIDLTELLETAGKIPDNFFASENSRKNKNKEEEKNEGRKEKKEEKKYQKISPYPFIIRDIAFFVPENAGVSVEKIIGILADNAGEFLARPPRLFDTFQKPGTEKISYAFRLVFQSPEKTLTDEDANTAMNAITNAVQKNSWEVR